MVTYLHDHDGATETSRQVEAAGRKTLVVQLDTRDESSVEALFDQTIDAFGRIDILVNSAGQDASGTYVVDLDLAAFDAWCDRWRAVGPDPDAMDRCNPVYVPRNHLVEEALGAATGGDLGPVRALLDVLAAPYDERPGLERYAESDPDGGAGFRTFCGT